MAKQHLPRTSDRASNPVSQQRLAVPALDLRRNPVGAARASSTLPALRAGDLLAAQRTIGNRAVQRLLAAARPAPTAQASQPIQRITDKHGIRIPVDWDNLAPEQALALKRQIESGDLIAEAGDLDRLNQIIAPPRRSSRAHNPPPFFNTEEVYKQKRGNTSETQQSGMEQFVQTGDIGEHYTEGGAYYAPKQRGRLYEQPEERSPLDAIADQTKLSASAQDTTAVAVSRSQKKIYIAHQAGKAARQALELMQIDDIRHYKIIPADAHHEGGLHAEMQIIYYCLVNDIDLKSLHAIGVAGGKGACEMCAYVLSQLGIGFSFIQKSHYQHLWVDPWKLAGKEPPFRWPNM